MFRIVCSQLMHDGVPGRILTKEETLALPKPPFSIEALSGAQKGDTLNQQYHDYSDDRVVLPEGHHNFQQGGSNV